LDPNTRPPTDIVSKNETVKLNSLATLIGHILTYEKKLREHFPKVNQDSEEVLKELNGTNKDCGNTDASPPNLIRL